MGVCLEAEHRTEATGELRTIPGHGAANHFPFGHAPEIKVFTLRIVRNALGHQIAFGNCEGRTAVRNHWRRVAYGGENFLKLARTTQFREDRIARGVEPISESGRLPEPLHRF